MKIATACIILATLVTFAEARRIKKKGLSLWEFREMISCGTGRSAILDYNGYGCYCGIGGGGKIVDSTDRCCKTHDACYKKLLINGNCKRVLLVDPWFFKSYNRDGCTGCSIKNTGCGRELCKCDQAAVLCFQQARFNPSNKYYDRSKCSAASGWFFG